MIKIFNREFTKQQLKDIAKANKLQYRVRSNQFVGSNCHFDCETETAWSYDWWCFFKEIDGQYWFNNYSYSVSTNGHQSKIRGLIEDLMGIEFYGLHKHVNYCDYSKGLQDNFKSGYIVKLYEKYVDTLRVIHKKGTQKKKNIERRKYLESLKSEIRLLETNGFASTFNQLYKSFRYSQKMYKFHLKGLAEKKERNRLKNSKMGKLFCIDRELPLIKNTGRDAEIPS